MNEPVERQLFFDDSGAVMPDWKRISSDLTQRFQGPALQNAFRAAALQWLEYLRESFGSAFVTETSPNFVLLTDIAKEKRPSVLDFCEKALAKIEQRLGEARWKTKLGPHVLIVFDNPDQYYSYIARYYRDGEHAQSSGVFINRGYAHIALPLSPHEMAHILVHELTHNCLAHLQIPAWVNEGMARTFERFIVGGYGPILDADLADRHHEFWDSDRIQRFWAGTLFDDPEGNELSYSLGEILIELAAQERRDFAGFLTHASYKDRGIGAARQFLGKSLGEFAGTFLGPGDWEPKPPDNMPAA
jgi:hypothetical protein